VHVLVLVLEDGALERAGPRAVLVLPPSSGFAALRRASVLVLVLVLVLRYSLSPCPYFPYIIMLYTIAILRDDG